MTTQTLPWMRRLIMSGVLLIIMQMMVPDLLAQMPDCISGQYMYGVFSPVTPSNRFPTAGKDSTEIRPVAFADGAVGDLMGGRRYYIRRNPGGGSTYNRYFYGSSAMAMDEVTNKFYLITQMGSSGSTDGDKDIIMIDPLAPTATGTVIGTISSTLDNGSAPGTVNMTTYHFVKAAASPGFPKYGYALGVDYRTGGSGYSTTRHNPLVRFNLCATSNCASPVLLGYLPDDGSSGIMRGMNLFNGDIAFDNAGNLYFFSSAFFTVSGSGRYTDSRLFRINAADIPTVGGTGTIPMTFVADFDALDSTGASGMCFDQLGNIYLSTRVYINNNNLGEGFWSELHVSYDTMTTGQVTTFGPVDDSVSAGDLASCYFPMAVLADNKIALSASYQGGQVHLKWEVNTNQDVVKYELQQSDDGQNYTTIATIHPSNTFVYSHVDPVSGADKYRYYRVRQVRSTGIRLYSNVKQVRLNSKITLIGKIAPNPFRGNLNFSVDVRTPSQVQWRLIDQSGRTVRTRHFNVSTGFNKLSIAGLDNLQRGIYFAEITLDEEIIREKLIKE